jgi:hypothetical protein
MNQFDRKHYYFARSLKECGVSPSELTGPNDNADTVVFWVAVVAGFLLFFL